MNYFLTIFLSMPGVSEWLIILVVVVLLFGGKKIPELMKGLGTGIKEFKEASKTDDTPKSETKKEEEEEEEAKK